MKNFLLFAFTVAVSVVNAQQTIWSENFDVEDLSAWTLIDGDRDGFNFGTTQMVEFIDGGFTPIGTPFLYSMSYTQFDSIGNVFPDNWAITPQIQLGAVAEGEKITLSWAIVDSAYSWNPSPNNENYAIYIATTNDTSAFIAGGVKYTESNTPIVYTVRTLDLTEYAGQSIYIAFRHYNVSDANVVTFSASLEIDDMSIYSGGVSVSANESKSAITLFPNPVKSTFHLTIPDGFDVTGTNLEIVDLSGKVVAHFDNLQEKYEVDNLSSGIYIARISDAKHSISVKLVKE
jgi:hypothetical protein